MITTHHNITVEHREHWQPCGVCGDSTPFYAHFTLPQNDVIAPRPLAKAIWPICSEWCYWQIPAKLAEIQENRKQCMNWGIG